MSDTVELAHKQLGCDKGKEHWSGNKTGLGRRAAVSKTIATKGMAVKL